MSLPYSATVFVNWLPVTCMPSPESPAKRMTAWSITSRLCLTGGTSASVDILVRTLRSSMNSPTTPGEHGSVKRMRRCNERMAARTARRSRYLEDITLVRVRQRKSPSGSNVPYSERDTDGPMKRVVRGRKWLPKRLRGNVVDSRRANQELRQPIEARELPSSHNDGRSLRARIAFQADGAKPASPSRKSPSRRCSLGSACSQRYSQPKRPGERSSESSSTA